MIKLKIIGVRPEVDKLIKDVAEHLQLYNPRLPEESQCSSYHVFREMCLMKEDICTYNEFVVHLNQGKYHDYSPPGYYLLSRIHPNARIPTIDAVNKVRDIIKKGEAAKVKIIKK